MDSSKVSSAILLLLVISSAIAAVSAQDSASAPAPMENGSVLASPALGAVIFSSMMSLFAIFRRV
ncbi:hypothetical protein AMTRI_Chr03g141930 [Amborella trichopoda]